MTEPRSDEEFETFLKRRTLLPNGMTDDDKLEPPKALDALVLKRAREAVREQQQSNRAPRWAKPVALAATILLCLSVVLNISLNTNRPTGDLRRQAPATADKAPAAAPGAATAGGLREEVVTGAAPREAILPEAKVAEPRAPRPPVLAQTRAPTPGSPPAASAASVTSAAQAPASATAPPHSRDPEAWLRQIDALRAEGKTAQADSEMQQFRAMFPAYSAKPRLPAPSEPPK